MRVKRNFCGRDKGAETVSLKFNRLFAETRRSYTQPRHFGHFASQELIIVWLEVRVFPAPPRSLTQTEISRFSAKSPEPAGIRAPISLSAICLLDFQGLFGAFVSASQNRVSRQWEPVLVETRFECCHVGTQICAFPETILAMNGAGGPGEQLVL
jgi:hypothetical protein